MIRLLVLALGVAAGLVAAHAQTSSEVQTGSLVVREPWIRATPGGAQVGAGYLLIENNGSTPDRLISIETEVAHSAEVHEGVVSNGVSSMRPVDNLDVPAGGRLELKPGGSHVMLMGLKRPLKAGERLAGVLIFEKAGRVPVVFDVRKLGAGIANHPQTYTPQ